MKYTVSFLLLLPSCGPNCPTWRAQAVSRVPTTPPIVVKGAGAEWERLIVEVCEPIVAGEFDRGLVVANKALKMAKENAGPRHPDVALTLHQFAYLYRRQGQYATAELYYKRSIEMYRSMQHSGHDFLAMTLDNLALFYQEQGRYTEAESQFNRSLALKEKAAATKEIDLRMAHHDVASTLEYMAVLYRKMDRGKEAELLKQRAVRIRATQRQRKAASQGAG